MRYKAVFIVGFAAGFMAGARSGREAYDKIVGYGQRVAGHPKVQQAASAAQAKATDLAKTAAAKAPDVAKSAASSASSAAKTAQAQVVSQVPRYVTSAKQAAGKIPGLGGSGGGAVSEPDDVAADGNLVYPVDGGPSSSNGVRYTPDTP
jgi:hypothetical protein